MQITANILKIKKIPLILLVFAIYILVSLVFQINTRLFPGYNVYDIKRLLELILLGICALWLLSSLQIRLCQSVYAFFPSFIRIALLLILMLGIISAGVSAVPKMAYLELSLYVLLFFFALFIASQRINYGNKFDRLLIGITIICAAVYSGIFFYSYIKFLLAPPVASVFIHNLFSGFINVRFFSQYQLWTLFIVALPLFYFKRTSIIYYLVILLTELWWVLAWINGAKSVRLSVIIALIAVFFIFRRKSIKWILQQGLFILVAFIIYKAIFYFTLFHSGRAFASHAPVLALAHNVTSLAGSTYFRLKLWQFAVALIKAHPLLGVGPMHFSFYNNGIAAHPHNALLLFMVEWGIPGALIALFVVGYAGFAWLKLVVKSHSISPLTIALTATFIAMACDSMLDGVIVTPMSQVMLALTVGWGLGIYQTYQIQRQQKQFSILATIIMSSILVASCLGILIGIFPTVFSLPQHEIGWYFTQNVGSHFFRPRFWLQGWIGK